MSGSSAHYAERFCCGAESCRIMREDFVVERKVAALCEEVLLWSGRSPHYAGRFCCRAKARRIMREDFVMERKVAAGCGEVPPRGGMKN